MPADRRVADWLARTWRCLEAMTDPATGLPADSIGDSLAWSTHTTHTSPTNIGGLLWSTVAARDLRLVDDSSCAERCHRTLTTLASLPRHQPSGMFYNWYAAETGALLTGWPDASGPIHPFLSSVDNGWLAAGLMVAAEAVPQVRAEAGALLEPMDFAVFHDSAAGPPGPGGRLRGGFWDADPGQPTVVAPCRRSGPEVFYTPHHYDLLNSEPRIASYVGIARGQVPPEHYAALDAPLRSYRGLDVVPTFGGSMFEALMPGLFVPEEEWAPDTWGHTLRGTVRAQREYALTDKGYAAWGFSPSACPGGGYAEWGVPPIAWLPDGYPSERNGEAVVTPHASALAIAHEPVQSVDNLAGLATDHNALGPGGFRDAVGLPTGRLSDRHLALDQAMVMAALANHAGEGVLRHWFCTDAVTDALRPVVATRIMPNKQRSPVELPGRPA